MKKKLFAFDIDGTLLDPMTHQVPKTALQAIRELKSQGHIVGIATGRNKMQVRKVVNTEEFDFLILCNGGYAEVFGNPILMESFNLEEKQTVVSLLNQLGLEYGITTEEHLFAVNPSSDKVKKVIDAFDVYTPYQKTDLTELEVFQFNVYEDTKTIPYVTLNQAQFLIHSYGGFGYDIVLRKQSKGNALERIALYYSMDIEDCYAFGDGDNDAHFLQIAGTGIVMGNGSDSAIKAADFITTAVNENGIYNALKIYGFVK